MKQRKQRLPAAKRTPKNVPAETDTTTRARVAAGIVTNPSIAAACVVEAFGNGICPGLDIGELVTEMDDSVEQAQGGDLSRAEAMLISQAHALQSIFVNLARRSAVNMGEYMGAAETYMRLALKAQSQCRTTLEALAEMKNPKQTAFVRQQNIANGPQQVNNASIERNTRVRAGLSGNQSNELMAVKNDKCERLDLGKAAAASRSDTEMEALETIQRPKNY